MNGEAPKQKTWISTLLFSVLTIAVALVTSIAVFPRWRDQVRSLVQRPFREVLAKTSGDLTGKGDQVTVVKLKTNEGIVIEVFEFSKEENAEVVLARLRLEEKRDAFMSFSGDATNLGLVDFDSDGTLEIMAPAYDENFVPRLNVFKFDPANRSFVRQGPDSGR